MNIRIHPLHGAALIGAIALLVVLAWKHQDRIAGAFGVSQPNDNSLPGNVLKTCKSFQNGSALAHWHNFGTQGTMFDRTGS